MTIDAIRARHVAIHGRFRAVITDYCPVCKQEWPCDTTTVLAALDEKPKRNPNLAYWKTQLAEAQAEVEQIGDMAETAVTEPTTEAGKRLAGAYTVALVARPDAGGLTWNENAAVANEAIAAIEAEARAAVLREVADEVLPDLLSLAGEMGDHEAPFNRRAWLEPLNRAIAAIDRRLETHHAYVGRHDRRCEVCGLADRAPVHRLEADDV